MSDFNTKIIEEFRTNNGKLTGNFDGMNLLLVTAKGAKTGKESTFPVAYTREGDKYVIVASKGGAPTHPAWYHNLLANPQITVEVGNEKFQAKATNITGKERDRLFAQHASIYPGFNDYIAMTERIIPVFLLERIK